MIRILILVLALVAFSAPPVNAEKLEVYGLTEEQAAKLKLEAAQMKSNTSPTRVSERMAEYAEIGQKYGVALAATAKELGIAADEILNTTVGKIALILIVYKVMGEEVIGLLVGVPYIILGFAAWVYMFRRLCVIQSVVREPIEGQWWRKKTVTYYDAKNSAIWDTRWVMLGVLCVTVFIPAFFMIFG